MLLSHKMLIYQTGIIAILYREVCEDVLEQYIGKIGPAGVRMTNFIRAVIAVNINVTSCRIWIGL